MSQQAIKRLLTNPWVLLILFLIAINLLWIIGSYVKNNTLPVGTAAPDFTLRELGKNDKLVKLSDFKGKKNVILLFWATWCRGCLKEMTALARSIDKVAGEEIEVVGVNLDFGNEEDAVRFVKGHKIQFTNLYDDGAVAELYSVTTLPTIYIIDRAGNICFGESGYVGTKKIVSKSRMCAASRAHE